MAGRSCLYKGQVNITCPLPPRSPHGRHQLTSGLVLRVRNASIYRLTSPLRHLHPTHLSQKARRIPTSGVLSVPPGRPLWARSPAYGSRRVERGPLHALRASVRGTKSVDSVPKDPRYVTNLHNSTAEIVASCKSMPNQTPTDPSKASRPLFPSSDRRTDRLSVTPQRVPTPQ